MKNINIEKKKTFKSELILRRHPCKYGTKGVKIITYIILFRSKKVFITKEKETSSVPASLYNLPDILSPSLRFSNALEICIQRIFSFRTTILFVKSILRQIKKLT
ncbi:hypothetical protein GE061_004606 [Apolygus lucorum]|uniref:Uncharacterized protein n=1 Tax=Apolygus lucorum TaxID=248454 RepID=A0A8S9X1G0_APOLU|nr:hypothetical protein GE061_004606 [Apolygus lucorum]